MDNKTDYEAMTKDDLRAEVEARMERLDCPTSPATAPGRRCAGG